MVADEALQGTLRHDHRLGRLRRMEVLGFSDDDCRSHPHCHQRRMRIGSGCAELALVAAASSMLKQRWLGSSCRQIPPIAESAQSAMSKNLEASDLTSRCRCLPGT